MSKVRVFHEKVNFAHNRSEDELRIDGEKALLDISLIFLVIIAENFRYGNELFLRFIELSEPAGRAFGDFIEAQKIHLVILLLIKDLGKLPTKLSHHVERAAGYYRRTR